MRPNRDRDRQNRQEHRGECEDHDQGPGEGNQRVQVASKQHEHGDHDPNDDEASMLTEPSLESVAPNSILFAQLGTEDASVARCE
jgi:hypothetical protein